MGIKYITHSLPRIHLVRVYLSENSNWWPDAWQMKTLAREQKYPPNHGFRDSDRHEHDR